MAATDHPGTLITVSEAAQLMNIAPGVVEHIIANGELTGRIVDGELRILFEAAFGKSRELYRLARDGIGEIFAASQDEQRDIAS